jgi:hypothetical protein
MADVEVDYLVVGAGASGMAFTDALIAAQPDVEVLMVDRRHGPGGHWLDAYPFVRLHQPSATYGVPSRLLGTGRVDERGSNAGWYERAAAAEIVSYYATVLDEVLRPAGVRFLGMANYQTGDGHVQHGDHVVTSILSGRQMTVQVRRRVVDATYTESSIPSTHTPRYSIAGGAVVVSPNGLAHRREPASGYTVIGGGKTAMDTCDWLLGAGVDPARIRWIRARDGWFFNRAFTQPLDQVGSYMQLQASWLAAAATTTDSADFAYRLEADGIFLRIDAKIEPRMFRGATLSAAEVTSLASISDVVRKGRVRHVGTDRLVLDGGELPTEAGHVHVDCTAAGVRPTVPKPIFEPGRITLQYVTNGFVPFGAATIGAVEALKDEDDTRNKLCPPVVFSGDVTDILGFARAGLQGVTARATDADLGPWTESCPLNPARGAAAHLADPRVSAAFATIGANLFPALENLERLAVGSGEGR